MRAGICPASRGKAYGIVVGISILSGKKVAVVTTGVVPTAETASPVTMRGFFLEVSPPLEDHGNHQKSRNVESFAGHDFVLVESPSSNLVSVMGLFE